MSRYSHYPETVSPITSEPIGVAVNHWEPHILRYRPLRRPNQDYTAATRISGFEATDVRHWQPLEVRYVPRFRRAQQEPGHLVLRFIEVSSTPDQWLIYDPHQYHVRPPQRNYTAQTILSGFETTDSLLWEGLTWQKARVPRIRRQEHLAPVFFVAPPNPTSPDQWKPYEPYQYRRRPPNRDYTTFLIYIGVIPSPVIDEGYIAFQSN